MMVRGTCPGKDGNVFSVDDCSLSDLPEYEEHVEPEELDLEMGQ